MHSTSTIIALATPHGSSGIAVIRLSGPSALGIVESIFKGKKLSEQSSHTAHFGIIKQDEQLIDEVVVTVFKGPNSYTGEDIVEISCHGSMYIVSRIISCCIEHGAELAKAGEFTKRAFMNGKLDLSQAEAVADIIASENASQHRIAIQQMRGGYSDKIKLLRQELIDFAALMELELDFSEEDVEFADRSKFLSVVNQTLNVLSELIQSFQLGNVIKKGIPVAIIGKPNVGKSTLLNRLLHEEKAIVSEIAGTTRDFIEDTIQLNGITYRFIDTAGIRETEDELESRGIERSFEKIKQARIVLYLADINVSYLEIVKDFNSIQFEKDQHVFIVLNKADAFANQCDAYDIEEAISTLTKRTTILVSAKENHQIDKLLELIQESIEINSSSNDIIVSNTRHLQSFREANEHLLLVQKGLNEKISGEFISIDIRAALQSLASITGQISNEDILSSVFSRFCIGK